MQKFHLIFDKIFFILLLILLAFIPLYPKLPLIAVGGTFVAIRGEDLFIASIVIIWAIKIITSKQILSLVRDKIFLTLAVFFFIGLISLISGIFLTQTVSPMLGLLHYLRRAEYMILLPIFMTVINHNKRAGVALLVLISTLFLADLYGLGQQFLGWDVISTMNSEYAKGLRLKLTSGARPNSTFAGHYDLAVFIAMSFALISAMIFYFKNKLVQISLVTLSGISLYVLILTAARLSFVAAFAGVVCSVILVGKKLFIGLIALIILVTMLYPSQLRDRLVSTITVNLLENTEVYVPDDEKQIQKADLNIPTLKIQYASDSASSSGEFDPQPGKPTRDVVPGEPTNAIDVGVYRSFGIRFDKEWPMALNAFYKNPFLGTGYSSLGLATDNDFLRSLGEIGILGTLGFIMILIAVFKEVWRNYHSSNRFIKYFSAGVISMIFVFILNALFIDVFEASKVATMFWAIIGINLGLRRI